MTFKELLRLMFVKLVSLVSSSFKSKYEKVAEARFKSILRGKTPPKQCFSCGALMLALERDKNFSRRDYYLCPKCGARQDVYGVIRQIRLMFAEPAEPKGEAEKEFESELERY